MKITRKEFWELCELYDNAERRMKDYVYSQDISHEEKIKMLDDLGQLIYPQYVWLSKKLGLRHEALEWDEFFACASGVDDPVNCYLVDLAYNHCREEVKESE